MVHPFPLLPRLLSPFPPFPPYICSGSTHTLPFPGEATARNQGAETHPTAIHAATVSFNAWLSCPSCCGVLLPHTLLLSHPPGLSLLQSTLAEAIAIVVAPSDPKTLFSVFRLTDEHTGGTGLALIQQCPKKGFHPHDTTEAIYEVSPHITMSPSLSLQLVDMRGM